MPQIQAPVLPASLEHIRELGFPDIISSMILRVKGVLTNAPRFLHNFSVTMYRAQRKQQAKMGSEGFLLHSATDLGQLLTHQLVKICLQMCQAVQEGGLGAGPRLVHYGHPVCEVLYAQRAMTLSSSYWVGIF